MGNILYPSKEEKLLLSAENPMKKCYDRCFVEIIVCINCFLEILPMICWGNPTGGVLIIAQRGGEAH
jgi:hypothetical protein